MKASRWSECHLSIAALPLSSQVPFLLSLALLFILLYSLSLCLLRLLLNLRWAIDSWRFGLAGGCWNFFISVMLCLLLLCSLKEDRNVCVLIRCSHTSHH